MNPHIPELIDAFRAGTASAAEAGDALLRHFQPWLAWLARSQLESRFHAKFDPADVVQQAMMQATRDFPEFRGTTEAELAAWLRRILGHVLGHEIRKYQGTAKRDLAREVSFDLELSDCSARLGDLLPADATSPTEAAARQEREIQLARVLARLPDDYRTILVLRHLEGLSHNEIARRLGRNSGAVRMLWVRALALLRQELGHEGRPHE